MSDAVPTVKLPEEIEQTMEEFRKASRLFGEGQLVETVRAALRAAIVKFGDERAKAAINSCGSFLHEHERRAP